MACAGAVVAGALAMACGGEKVAGPPFGPPAKLAFLQHASGASGGSPFATQPTVVVLDANGNRVLTATVSVHIAIGTNPAGGTLSGTADAAARNGVASFTGLAIDKAASGYTLIATAAGLTSATSELFAVVVGPAARIGIVTQPGGALGGAAFTTQPVFEVVDLGGNRVGAATAQVSVALGTNPASGTLSGTSAVTPQNGLASFTDLKIDKAGTGYTLTAAATGVTSVTTAAFDVVVGPAARLNFAVHPVGGPGGLLLSTQPKVEVTDLGGNRVTTSTAGVTLSFGTNRGNGTLSGTLTVAAASGLAGFTDLSVDKAASGYTLVAKASGLDSAVSAAFAITVGVPAKLAFVTQPVGGPGGGAFATQPTVEIQDAGGNRVTTSTASVTVAIGANPAGGTLAGTLTANAVAGLATFTNLSVNKAGSGYTLAATSGSLTSATSSPFSISVGAALRLAFVVQPGGATGGVAFATQPKVEVQDAGGNRVATDTTSVSISFANNPNGGTLSGTRTVTSVAGLVSYTNLSIDRTGSGYVLAAASTGLQSAASDSLVVSLGVASTLRFVTQPAGATGGTAFATQPVVELLDAGGNRVTTSTATVTMALGANLNGGVLSGTVAVSAVAGLASFTNLSINKSGGGYTLVASSTGVTDAVSATFGVAVGAAARLNFAQQPGNGTGGSPLSTQPRVEVLDPGGNRVTTSTASVTLALGTNPASGALSGTLTVSAVAGIATFTGLSVDRAGTGYTLVASSTVLTGATSTSFDITVGAPAKLGIVTQPAGAVGGLAFTTQPAVEIEDAGGNRVATATPPVTLAIGANPGGGVLAGTRAVAAVAGVVTYTNLSIDKAGSGYTLVASAGALTSATSAVFEVAVGAAISLRFATQPGGATGGTPFATPPAVEVIDAGGNRVTSSTANITLTLFDNPGAGTLLGTRTVNASSGLAAFTTLAIDRAATGYTLVATSSGLNSATSALFDVSVGAAARLAFAAEPGGATGGSAFSSQPVVQILDAGGNLATTSTASITIAIGANPGPGTLAGTLTVSAVGGIATFTDLSIDRASAGYTLVATSSGLTSGITAAFSVAVGSATTLRFTTQPGDAVGGLAFATPPAVEVVDAGGNRVTGSTASVTIALGANPVGGTLSGTTTRSAALGVATFTGLAIDLAGSGYTLVASSSGLTSGTSAAFTVAVGAATAVRFVTQPGGATGGSAFASQPAVEVVDAGGNRVTSSNVTVTLALGVGSPAGVLSGVVTLPASAGLATFTGLSVNLAGGGYSLVASSTPLTSVTSATFTVDVGAAAAVRFGTQPGAAAAATALSPQPVVEIVDAGGNRVTGSTASITIAVASGPSGTLSGTTTRSASSGLATFSGLSLNVAGSYTLAAASSGLLGAPSASFTVAVGPAAAVRFVTQPVGSSGGAALATQPAVEIIDAGGNRVTTSNASVTLTLGPGSPAGTLSGAATLPAASGLATFSGLSIDLAASGYTLVANSAGLSGGTSSSFTVAAGVASALRFVTQPGGAVGGTAFTTQPAVEVIDAGGNRITSSTASITLATGANPGGGVLSGTATVAAIGGVATFSGLSLNVAGNYTLVASSTGLTGVTSSSFSVAIGSAVGVRFVTQPSGASGGTAFGAQPTVEVIDEGGNRVTGSTASVTLAVGAGSPAGTLSGITTRFASSGLATFSGLSIDLAASGYTLVATSTGLASATSTSLTVTVGAASALRYVTQPGGATAGTAFATQPAVEIIDAGGNRVTSSASVTLTLGSGSPSGTLSGPATLPAASGLASFSGLSINLAGSGYTLVASSAGLASATSNTFTVAVGTSAAVRFLTQPGGATGGSAFTTQPVVEVIDLGGNRVTTSSASITLAVGAGSPAGTLSGTATVAATAGLATFSGLSINLASVTPYTLVASATGLTSATSSSFTVSVGSATAVRFTTQPSGATAATAFTTQPAVEVIDAGGNRVTTSSASITVALGQGSPAGTLSGTATLLAASGLATFSGLSIDLAASGYTLVANSSGLASATSSNFAVAAGAASALRFVTQPGGAVGGTAFTTQPVVEVIDAGGNRITSSTASITLAIGTNPGGGALSGTATVAASGGVATFSGLSLNVAGNYTLVGSSTGLTGVTSSSFPVAVGAPARVRFVAQPSGASGGTAFGAQPTVEIVDAGGNRVTTSTASITLALGAGSPAGTLSGTTTVSASVGLATFSGLSIDLQGSGYTLLASSSGLASATSSSFNVTVGSPATVRFVTQPGGASGGLPFATQPVVEVLDAGDNRVTTSSLNISMAIGANPAPGGTLSGTTLVSAVNGVATFTDLSINTANPGYTLVASGAGVTSATSNSFTVATGTAAAAVRFVTQPGGATAASAFAQQPTVEIVDAGNNRITNSTAAVTLAIGAGPPASTLSGTVTVNAVAGLATFAGLSIDLAGGPYTLQATSGILTPATSSSFNVSLGTPASVRFVTQPGGATGGTAFATQPTVEIVDAGNNRVTTSTASVTIAIGSNPSGGALSGTGTVSAVAGLGTFNGLSIDKAGSGYTLSASSGGLTTGTSASFTVAVGTATAVRFATQPAGAAGGTAFTTQPAVEIVDAGGNRVTASSASISLNLGAGSPGGTLSGTTTLTATSGLATLSGLSINLAGSGYTLAASSSGLTSATSATFTVSVGAAASLRYVAQPSSSTGGTPFATQLVVEILDAGGNRVTGSTASVTLALGVGSPAGTLSGTTTVAASGGVATFTGLSINLAGNGYTLLATSGALTGATSSAFNITVGPAAALRFSRQPGSATAGSAFGTQPAVEVVDAGGNRVTSSTASVTVGIGAGSPPGTLSGTATVLAAAGLASFSGLSINVAGSSYTLVATSGGLASGTSNTFTVAVGAAASVRFVTQPAGAAGGTAFTTQPAVEIIDAGGNRVTTSTANVTLAIGGGSPAGTLSGTATLAATNGLATFSGLSINLAGGGYTLVATSAGLASATSVSFAVTVGAASALRYVTQPSGAAGGTAFTTQPQVEIIDAGGNRITTSTASVTLAIGGGSPAGTLSGTRTLAATNGLATFSGLSIDLAGSGYTLVATSTGLASATSVSFTVSVGAAAALRYVTQPGGATGGSAFTTQPAVEIIDAGGNRVTTSSASITLAVGAGSPAGTLSGTATVAATAGLATFSGLSINLASVTPYTLVASATGLTSATSSSFTVSVGPSTAVRFTTQPSGATAATAFTTQPAVEILDAGGNRVTTSTGNVTLAIGGGSPAGTLSGTATLAVINGVATFSGLSVNLAGSGYTLVATSGTLASATSTSFSVAVGTAAALRYVTQPAGAAGGTAFGTQPAVEVIDAGGNRVTTSTASVTIALGAGSPGAALSGTTTLAATSGLATFTGLSIDLAGGGYTLTASSTGLASVTSASFTVTVGGAAALRFVVQPGGAAGGAPFTTQPTVEVVDAGGNRVTTSGASVAMAIGPGSPPGLLDTTTTVNASSGLATFTNLTINLAGDGYTLVARSSGLTDGTSASFTVTPGAAASLRFFTQPGGASGGTAFTQQPAVEVIDAGGNRVTSSTASITVALFDNPAGGTLSGTLTMAASSGLATFSGLSINRSGVYTLRAASNGLGAALSGNFNVAVGAPATLRYVTQVAGATGGSPFGQQPSVEVLDPGGNRVTTSSAAVALGLGAGSPAGTLSGTATLSATNGLATFAGLSINLAGAGYTLVATSGSLPAVTSTPFTVLVGTATQLAFIVQPAGAEANRVFATQPVVEIRDAGGNRVTTATASVTLNTQLNPFAGVVLGTKTVPAVGGRATYTNVGVDKAGSAYRLIASATNLNSAASDTFDVVLIVSAVSVGDAHTCGISAPPQLIAYCWGSNAGGQLGRGDSTPNQTTPAIVTGATAFDSVTANGANHTCAIRNGDGVAFCWGFNSKGQLGNNTPGLTKSNGPIIVNTTTIGWKQIMAGLGSNVTCGLNRVTGRAYCWGEQTDGALGNGVTTGFTVTPDSVRTDNAFAMLSGGNGHTCALTASGKAFCWGRASSGQLGTNSTTGVATPDSVRGGLTFTLISAGATHTCGLSGGAGYCWGANDFNQLGITAALGSCTVSASTVPCATTPVAVTGGLTFRLISAGGQHSCGISTSNVAYCWGLGSSGQLGTGSTANSAVPVPVAGGLSFATIEAGTNHTCGVTTTGQTYCWGNNTLGKLGNNSTVNSSVPVQVLVPTP